MAEWHAIVVDGPDARLRAFTAGFLAGHGAPRATVLHGPDIPVEPGSFGERLQARLHGGRHEVLLVDASLAAALVAALAREADGIGLRVAEHAALTGGSFEFTAETPSREAATRIHAELQNVPAGVTLADQEREEVDPDAGGVELYAPVHAYTFRVKGRATGDVDGVLALHRRLKGLDFVSVEPLRLDETPIISRG